MKTFEDKVAAVYYHEAKQMVELRWKGFAKVEEYKTVVEAAGEAVPRYSPKIWVSDQRRAKAVPEEARQWLQEDFIPRMLKLGVLQKVAFLLSEDLFNQMYAKGLARHIEMGGVEVGYFGDVEKMERWLRGEGQVA